MTKTGKIFLLSGCCLFAFIIGWFAHILYSANITHTSTGLEVRQAGYQFINPLLECEFNSGLESKDLKSFKNFINEDVESYLQEGSATQISVYYRELNNGPWYGINEREKFKPASLLKVPTMIAYYKMAETDPGLLSKILTADKTASGINENIVPGSSYTVEELIWFMITKSDNLAFEMLSGNIGDKKINQIHQDLGLTSVNADTPEDFISVKEYSSLFRILYNASYLNRDMSEKALALLSKSYFDDGLADGIPESVTIANKYGIAGFADNGIKQLHDCGIIYYPKHHYLLCIMTRGENVDKLSSVISTISSTIYQEINKKY